MTLNEKGYIMPLTFDFGSNWLAFSNEKVNARCLESAGESLRNLIGSEYLIGRSFLDIGCGSGLFSIAAAQYGAARVVGFDVSEKSIEASRRNLEYLATDAGPNTITHFRVGDVLDKIFLGKLPKFDIVYAWGSLHHTGSMWQAIRNAASLVESEEGMLVLSIYNHHWTSPIWKQVKRSYNLSPGAVRPLLHCSFATIIYVAVWVATYGNPLQKERGMNFWYDVIDWLGGYPYEYASIDRIAHFVESLGLQMERVLKPRIPTGCNEFVFRRAPRST